MLPDRLLLLLLSPYMAAARAAVEAMGVTAIAPPPPCLAAPLFSACFACSCGERYEGRESECSYWSGPVCAPSLYLLLLSLSSPPQSSCPSPLTSICLALSTAIFVMVSEPFRAASHASRMSSALFAKLIIRSLPASGGEEVGGSWSRHWRISKKGGKLWVMHGMCPYSSSAQPLSHNPEGHWHWQKPSAAPWLLPPCP